MTHLFQFRATVCVCGSAAVCTLAKRRCKASETILCTAHLRAVFDVVSFVEAKMAQVVGWWPFAGLACLRGQGEVWEMVRQRAEALHNIVERAVWRGALVEIIVQGLVGRSVTEQQWSVNENRTMWRQGSDIGSFAHKDVSHPLLSFVQTHRNVF